MMFVLMVLYLIIDMCSMIFFLGCGCCCGSCNDSCCCGSGFFFFVDWWVGKSGFEVVDCQYVDFQQEWIWGG